MILIIFEVFFQKIKYDDREIWNDLSLKELEIKKQLASFQAKIFILEKKVNFYKKSNKELDEQNKNYYEQVKNLLIEKNYNDKVIFFVKFMKNWKFFEISKEKKKFDKKLKNIADNYKISEEIYNNLKHVLTRNIEEIDAKAYNKAKKILLKEKEWEFFIIFIKQIFFHKKKSNQIQEELKK